MDLSNSVKRRFIKDHSLPIPVTDEPYFTYFINLYGYSDLYAQLELLIQKLGNEEAFFQKSERIIHEASTFIQSSPAYDDMLKNLNFPKMPVKKGTVFHKDNNELIYISIDLKSANFHAMKRYNSNLVENTDTYEQFLSKFTDIDYFLKSKSIRQVIFGKTRPKRLSFMINYIMYKIYQALQFSDSVQFICKSNDEICVTGVNEDLVKKLLLPVKLPPISVTTCKVTLIGDTPYFKKFYLSGKLSGKTELKCVPKHLYAQVYKYVEGLPLNEEYDLVFRHENQLARFITPIKL